MPQFDLIFFFACSMARWLGFGLGRWFVGTYAYYNKQYTIHNNGAQRLNLCSSEFRYIQFGRVCNNNSPLYFSFHSLFVFVQLQNICHYSLFRFFFYLVVHRARLRSRTYIIHHHCYTPETPKIITSSSRLSIVENDAKLLNDSFRNVRAPAN